MVQLSGSWHQSSPGTTVSGHHYNARVWYQTITYFCNAGNSRCSVVGPRMSHGKVRVLQSVAGFVSRLDFEKRLTIRKE